MAWPRMLDTAPPAGVAIPPHRAVVRPDWVDYNGHMSEAYYVLIFGDATDAFYDLVELHDAYRREQNVSLYTVEAHIRYLIEAHDGDALSIETRLLCHDAKRLRLHHTMRRTADGDILAVTEIMALHVDKARLRACPFRAPVAARLDAVAHGQQALPPPQRAMSQHWLASNR